MQYIGEFMNCCLFEYFLFHLEADQQNQPDLQEAFRRLLYIQVSAAPHVFRDQCVSAEFSEERFSGSVCFQLQETENTENLLLPGTSEFVLWWF